MKMMMTINLLLIATLLLSCNQPQDIDTYLTELHEDGKLNGNVLVIQNDTVLYENSFGYADGGKQVKLNQDYRFNIGSIYKEFPAVAIMQLHEKGKLKLSDKLSHYVSDLPGWSDSITVRSLLQYSSGLPKIKFDEHFSKGTTVTEEIIMNDLKNVEQLEFKPETDYLYTNYSPMLLMKIVENVATQDFISYAQLNMFQPYGLVQTKVNSQYPYKDKTLMAMPFNDDFEEDNYNITIDWILFSSTTFDMYRWFKHLDAFDIVSKESMQQLSEEAIQGDNIQAPLGRGDWGSDEIKLHLHHGSSGNYESLVRHYKQEGLMIILLTNQKHGNVHDIADNIYQISQSSVAKK